MHMLCFQSSLIVFESKITNPVPRKKFQKNRKNWCFLKNTTTDHICAKNEFLDQNTATDWILLSWKFWNPMLWSIKNFKKSQKWPIFYPFGSGKWIWKKSKIQIQIYNSPHELWKKSRFCQVFSRKIDFFSDFVSFFSFFLWKNICFRIRQRFHFSDFINFSRGDKNFYFQFYSKKLFISICLRRKKKFFHFKFESSSISCPRANFLCDKILLKFWDFVIVVFPFNAESFK